VNENGGVIEIMARATVTGKEKWTEPVKEKEALEKSCAWSNISLDIPNFNLREILRRLEASNWCSIWPNFTQFFSKIYSHATRRILRRLRGPNRCNMGYILHRLEPPNRCSIFSAKKKSNFEFLFFQSFLHRLWVETDVEDGILHRFLVNRRNISSNIYKNITTFFVYIDSILTDIISCYKMRFCTSEI